MIPVERRQIILEMVAEKGIVSIAELTDRMNVSHMTIRRDLQKLEQQGAVVLVSGGVQSPGRVAHEPSHQVKTALALTQKAAIGKLAASLVQPGSCIYLDAGTTTLAIAQHLIHMESLTVVTNDFVIANYLLDNSNCTIIHTGGAVCRENRSCVGEAAATMLRSLMIDQAFISASSWSVRGISTPAEDKVTVKRAIASASRQRVLVCDATKYGQVATWLALPLSEFDQIITDDGLPESASLSAKLLSPVNALYNKEKYAKVPFTLMNPSGSSNGWLMRPFGQAFFIRFMLAFAVSCIVRAQLYSGLTRAIRLAIYSTS